MKHIKFSERSEELQEAIGSLMLLSDEELEGLQFAIQERLENRAFERELLDGESE